MTHNEAIEAARQSAQIRRIQRDNEEFYLVLSIIQQAKAWIEEDTPGTYLVEDLTQAAELIQKRILHIVSAKDARELSTDGRLK